MIEQTIRDYLTEALAVPVYMERPETNVPASYVLVEKTGGSERNHICSAMIALQSYGESLLQAAQLNEAVKESMRGITALPSVSRAQLNTDYNYTDPVKKRYRYQAVYNLVYFNS